MYQYISSHPRAFWGVDFMDEDADPDFDESLEEDELNGGW
jgi:hypothetical protein